jgi:hypothetical protein
MNPDTYRTRFNEHLEDATTAAGDFPRILQLAGIYLGWNTADRQREFEEWLMKARLDCGQCGQWFEWQGAVADEDEMILCPGCARR